MSIAVGDVLEWSRNYEGEKFHALICDPPYELGFMGKKWDNSGAAFNPETWVALAEHMHDGAFGMAFASSRGWHRLAVAIEDAGLIIHPAIFGWSQGAGFPKATRIDSQIDKAVKVDCPDCGDLTQLAVDYLEATGYKGDSFADLTRPHYFNELTTKAGLTIEQTSELSALNIAGYNKRFQCNRCNGSGKVSAYDVREVVGDKIRLGDKKAYPINNVAENNSSFGLGNGSGLYPDKGKITTPTTPLAQAFEGHRYGRQALKPALEPIIVWQKPYRGKPIDNIVATGAGALNIDGGRIGTSDVDLSFMDRHKKPTRNGWGYSGSPDLGYTPNPQGRWPANFVLSHTPDCVDIRTTKTVDVFEDITEPETFEAWYENYDFTTEQNDWDMAKIRELYEQSEKAMSVVGKRKVGEREEVSTVWQCVAECPVRRLGEQSGVLTSGGGIKTKKGRLKRHGVFGEMTSDRDVAGIGGDKGTAARYFFNADWSLDVAEQLANADPVRYQAKASRKERDAGLEGFEQKQSSKQYMVGMSDVTHSDGIKRKNKPIMNHNPHPTVKPITLMKHLATLLLPPDRYAPNRRLLVPFSGSGSEMIGAILAGWDFVQGVELSAEYAEIAEARIKHWTKPEKQMSF